MTPELLVSESSGGCPAGQGAWTCHRELDKQWDVMDYCGAVRISAEDKPEPRDASSVLLNRDFIAESCFGATKTPGRCGTA